MPVIRSLTWTKVDEQDADANIHHGSLQAFPGGGIVHDARHGPVERSACIVRGSPSSTATQFGTCSRL